MRKKETLTAFFKGQTIEKIRTSREKKEVKDNKHPHSHTDVAMSIFMKHFSKRLILFVLSFYKILDHVWKSIVDFLDWHALKVMFGMISCCICCSCNFYFVVEKIRPQKFHC